MSDNSVPDPSLLDLMIPAEEVAAYETELATIAAGPIKPTINRLSYRHLRLMDFMLRNPHMRLGEIADHLNYTQSWVSIIVSSDLFKAELARRRSTFEMMDNLNISNKINRLANAGLDGMLEVLEREPDPEVGEEGPSFNQFRAATELALKAAGYLNQQAKGPTVVVQNNNINAPTAVDPDVLAKARQGLLPPIEGELGP